MFFTVVGFLALAVILLLATVYLGVVTFLGSSEFGGNVESYVWWMIVGFWILDVYLWYVLCTNAPFTIITN